MTVKLLQLKILRVMQKDIVFDMQKITIYVIFNFLI